MTSQRDARDALTSLRAQQLRANKQLGIVGAFESRISSAQQVITTAREAFVASSSQITSADIAEESAQLVRGKILQQATVAVLAQANAQGQVALKLLGTK